MVERLHADGSRRRLADCAKRNPDDETYWDGCCRFPKSCSPYPYDETPVSDEDLEPLRFSWTDVTRNPHPDPCRDCGRTYIRGEHVVWSVPTPEGGMREVWKGCVDCFLRRTDPNQGGRS